MCKHKLCRSFKYDYCGFKYSSIFKNYENGNLLYRIKPFKIKYCKNILNKKVIKEIRGNILPEKFK